MAESHTLRAAVALEAASNAMLDCHRIVHGMSSVCTKLMAEVESHTTDATGLVIALESLIDKMGDLLLPAHEAAEVAACAAAQAEPSHG